MGAAIDALGDSIDISTRNPNLVLGAVVSLMLLVVVGGLLSFVPLFGPMVTNVVVTPIALAGMVAMANAAAVDSASFSDFTGGISDHCVTLMGAYALLFAIQIGVAVVFVMAMFVVGIGVLSAGSTASDPGAMLGAVGGTLLLVLALLAVVVIAVAIVTQFLDVAVVVGEADATGSFAEAIDLVTSGPLSVIGYSLLRGVVVLVGIGIPVVVGVVAIAWGLDAGRSFVPVLGLGVVVAAVPVGFAFMYSYHVAYYRRRIGAAP